MSPKGGTNARGIFVACALSNTRDRIYRGPFPSNRGDTMGGPLVGHVAVVSLTRKSVKLTNNPKLLLVLQDAA